jgi:hypothetical protein
MVTSVGPEKKMWGPVCRTRGCGSRSKTEQRELETEVEVFQTAPAENLKATERKMIRKRLYSFKGGDESQILPRSRLWWWVGGGRMIPVLKNKTRKK